MNHYIIKVMLTGTFSFCFIFMLFMALTLSMGCWGTEAHATTIAVNTIDDELNNDGDCSLREAIRSANLDTAVDACLVGSGADTIDIPPGIYTLTINGTNEEAAVTGDLDITNDLTITGIRASATIIDGGGIDRVFDIRSPVTVQITQLTIQNGSISAGSGGGIRNTNGGTLTLTNTTVTNNTAATAGGGIYNSGNLTLNESTFTDNTASSGGGGGIRNHGGNLTITSSTISSNIASEGGGIGNTGGGAMALTICLVSNNTANGIAARGGGIYNDSATASLHYSTVSGNISNNEGGGIRNNNGSVTLTNSEVSDNTASSNGGGLHNTGTFTIERSTTRDNIAGGSGGGIYSTGTLTVNRSTTSGNTGTSGGGIYNASTATFTNSTISGNIANDDGGGFYNGNNGTLTLNFSTISNNTAFDQGDGIFNSPGDSITFSNTIVAVHNDDDCSGSGTFTSQGYNLDSNNTCNFIASTDLPGINPLLDTLHDNGGPTLTHALLAGSPAIDAGNNTDSPTIDQRGALRPPSPISGTGPGITSDIGAYEYGGIIPVFTTIWVADHSVSGNMDKSITISSGRKVVVYFALAPESNTKNNADWWVALSSPFGLYWFTLDSGWIRSDTPALFYGGPLLNLPPYTILEMSNLPVGTYTFYFGVDMIMNGTLDTGSEQFYYDSIDVNITP